MYSVAYITSENFLTNDLVYTTEITICIQMYLMHPYCKLHLDIKTGSLTKLCLSAYVNILPLEYFNIIMNDLWAVAL